MTVTITAARRHPAGPRSTAIGDLPPALIFSAMDVTADYADRVSSVLVKSRTSNQDLLRVITRVLPEA